MNDTPLAAAAERTARNLSDHPWLERLARAGFAASGLLHLVIGWVAAQVALGGRGEADQGGALEALRDAPGGPVLLWACVVGFAALALWQALEAIFGGGEAKDRLKAAGKAVLYGALGATSLTFALGGSTDSGESSTDLTATLMGMPLGRLLVGAVGLAVIAAGGYHVYKGLAKRFLDDLQPTADDGGPVGATVVGSGMVGYAAKGVALAIVGGLFVLAAATADPERSTGLDGALKLLVQQPLGGALLLAIALGLVLFGIYSFARARFADL
ncbi:DUF1206 domain-containing protein [Ornithinimicrobium tianjinense]|uniref:DUF1206 domain-containing protein n=1 Tax=Ornithinimicrobium tianjinense TaxID=1195761 RepID=A0A917BGS2_9MICO|nr:DUF1206 domain-containing protein [Ornithinimicrobium tianjinense]GGF39154.1 hypothetical protein GCM10011366_03460 [Ornithinimicrobium tianjinense]